MDYNQEKQAAVNMLVENGVDFDTAVDLVEKKAGELAGGQVQWTPGLYDRVTGSIAGGSLGYMAAKKLKAGGVGKFIGASIGANAGLVAGQKMYNANRKSMHEGDRLGKIDALKDAAFKRKHEKQAAVNMLVENGVDFDTAVDLVQTKSEELYGK